VREAGKRRSCPGGDWIGCDWIGCDWIGCDWIGSGPVAPDTASGVPCGAWP
jgi:hypothetical protein